MQPSAYAFCTFSLYPVIPHYRPSKSVKNPFSFSCLHHQTKMFSVMKCFVRIPPQYVLRTATVTNMLRLKIHISSCQTILSYFKTRCDTAMISGSLVGRLNISAQQIMVKVGSHEDVIRSTSMPAMIPHKGGLSRVSLTSASSEHVRTSG